MSLLILLTVPEPRYVLADSVNSAWTYVLATYIRLAVPGPSYVLHVCPTLLEMFWADFAVCD